MQSQHYAITGQALTDDDICETLGISSEKLKHLQAAERLKITKSIDAPLSADNSNNLSDIHPDIDQAKYFDEFIDRLDLQKEIPYLLSGLNKYERTLINDYFGLDGQEPKTYQQIANARGVTRSSIGHEAIQY